MGKKEFKELVVIESPFKGKGYKETAINVLYAKACMRDSLLKGEFPIASHLLYTQEGILNDRIEEERQLGINAGLAWGKLAKKRIIYKDRGISDGMKQGIEEGKKLNQIIIYRSLSKYKEFLEEIKKMDLKEEYEFKPINENFSGKK